MKKQQNPESETDRNKQRKSIVASEGPLTSEKTTAPIQMKRAYSPIQPVSESNPPMQRNELPQNVLRKMENSFGEDFGDVKIHQNSSRAQGMGALAFAQGEEVHFAPGQFHPQNAAGQQLIGHELAHVVQQRMGVSGKGPQFKLASGSEGQLEGEADRAGLAAEAGLKADVKMASPGDPQMKDPVPIDMYSSLTQGVGIYLGKINGKYDDVLRVQSALFKLGYKLQIDGICETETLKAIADYHSDYRDPYSDHGSLISPFDGSWQLMKARLLENIPATETKGGKEVESQASAAIKVMHAQYEVVENQDHIPLSSGGHFPMFCSIHYRQPDGGYYTVQDKKQITTVDANGNRELDYSLVVPVHQHLFVFPDYALCVSIGNQVDPREAAGVAMTATKGITKSQKAYNQVYFEDGWWMAQGYSVGKAMADLSPVVKFAHAFGYLSSGKDMWGEDISGLKASLLAASAFADLIGAGIAGSMSSGGSTATTLGGKIWAGVQEGTPLLSKGVDLLAGAGYFDSKWAMLLFPLRFATNYEKQVTMMFESACMIIDGMSSFQ